MRKGRVGVLQIEGKTRGKMGWSHIFTSVLKKGHRVENTEAGEKGT